MQKTVMTKITFGEGLPYKNLEVKKTYMNAMLAAGLPE